MIDHDPRQVEMFEPEEMTKPSPSYEAPPEIIFSGGCFGPTDLQAQQQWWYGISHNVSAHAGI